MEATMTPGHHGSWIRGSTIGGLIAVVAGVMLYTSAAAQKPAYQTWHDYAGGADGMQYSALKQIDKTNVGQLELAWFYQVPGPARRFGFNPVIVDGLMYVMAKDGAIVALDAVTGKEVWSHTVDATPTDRGINYWESQDRSDGRLLFSANGYLQAIDARTGRHIASFGKGGFVDFKEAVPRANPTGTPGHVFEDLILMGSATGEGYGSSLGYLRAYNVITGKLAWTFRTIPLPGEEGYETWPKDAHTYIGGANTWGEISIDEKRGIAYFPTGSATYDFYGADRIGANLFADCLIALDARTGKKLWHYQVVHHNIWDYDLVPAPKLMTVQHNGKPVDVVAVATKHGFLFVFDRVTGKPLWPIEERPVPRSDVPGEETYPTQPFPTWPPPFARQKVTVDDLNPYLDPEETAKLREILLTARNEGLFTPTSTRYTVRMPGELGGNNWGGVAGDPETGTLYVRTIDAPTLPIMSLRPRVSTAEGGTPEQRGRSVYAQHCESCHGTEPSNVPSPTQLGVDRFTKVIRSGMGQMPEFSETALPAQQMDALVAYFNNPAAGNLPRRSGPEPPPPPAGQTRYYAPYATWNANNGLPAIGPPWSEIVAYNLGEGTIKWRIPFGTVPSLAAKGITNTGSYHPTRNGLVVTAGGLLIAGTFGDRTFRIYDKETGKILWQKPIESGPEGMPAVYEVGGRQYIAFAARTGPIFDNIGRQSVAWEPGKNEAQGYYVFALPR
jgi:quinoprotein glucose dehydrogenase